ncbi:MAG TPA: phytoene desaturase [Flavobacteriales bacterium]|nr:phytoene desaturase [Flavobacteriales bacterium]
MTEGCKHTVIIGAGVAGMAAAIRTAALGHQVSVLEAASEPGGKLREQTHGGYRFDLGPSLFTWPELILELDALAREQAPSDASLPPPFCYERLDRSTHYFWENGKRLIAWSDRKQFCDACASEFDVPSEHVANHLAHSSDSFEATRRIFLEQSLHEWSTRKTGKWRAAARFAHRLPWLGTLHRLNERKLKEPHLVQLFDRYATYNGSDPHRAPAMMHVIPHLEHGQGTFFPVEGMVGITQHLHALGTALGVEYRFGHRALHIENNGERVTGVHCSDSDGAKHTLPADIVISNADIWPTFRNLLPDLPAPENILQQERSTSGVIFYWGVRTERPELHLHNILFSRDYRTEFKSIQQQGHPGDDPTVYIHISSKLKPDDAPKGCENWFVMVNVAANPTGVTAQLPEIRQAVLSKIQRTLGLEVEPLIETEKHFTPTTIESRTSSHLGALYGASSNSPLSAFLRHRNRSTQLQGLYFCGGSVHPGGGIPLCLLSARITSDLIEQRP